MASRIEELLHTLIDGSGKTISPQTSVERLFQDIIDGVTEFDPPTSRFEEMVQIFVQGGTYDNTPTSRAEIILKTAIDGSDEYPEPTNIFEDLLIQWCKIGVGKWDYKLENYQFNNSNYVRTGIFPFNAENMEKDWEIVINLNPSYGTHRNGFGIISNMTKSTDYMALRLAHEAEKKLLIWTQKISPTGTQSKTVTYSFANMDIWIRKNKNIVTIECGEETLYRGTLQTATNDADEIVVGAYKTNSSATFYYSTDYLNYFKFRWVEPVSENTATLGKAVIGKMILGTK